MSDQAPLTFALVRNTDILADGVMFIGGPVALCWRRNKMAYLFQDPEEVEQIYCRGSGIQLAWDRVTMRSDR